MAKNTTSLLWVAAGLSLVACNNDPPAADTGSGTSNATAPDDDGEAATAPGTTTAPATATAEGGGSESGSVASTGQQVGAKYDVLNVPDIPNPSNTCTKAGKGGAGSGEPEFSFLWAANSSEGTISKIDTEEVVEVGRFRTRPDSLGSPSRTSVSLSGHVAVANRSGGIAKFYATIESCEESNGDPGLQTSEDNIALPWDEEECRAWYIEFDYNSQRPVAWAPGDWSPTQCRWENEMLWTAGRYGTNQDEVILIDGDAGVVVDTVDIPGLKPDSFGLYGGAVDSEGNFWATGWASGNHLVRVDIDNMEATVYDGPSSTGNDSHWYGMTVDVNGFVWNCASRLARFDPDDEEWTVSPDLGMSSSGCMADADPDGLLWIGNSGFGITGVDREDFTVEASWSTPSSYGVSIDHQGFVWAVNGNGAHRVDPEDGTVTSYNGLVGAYTYSDMTGFALSVVGGVGPSG